MNFPISTPFTHALLLIVVLSAFGCKKEEKVTIPGAPSLQTPVNGAVSVSVFPTYTWNAVQGATSYEIQVSNSGGTFTGSDLRAQVPVGSNTTYKNATNQYPIGVYYWRVRASNQAGNGNWSEIFTFSVTTNSPDQPGPVSADLLIYEPNLPQGISYRIFAIPGGERVLSCAGSQPANCDVEASCTFVRYGVMQGQYVSLLVKYENGPNAGQTVAQGSVSVYGCQRIRVGDL